MGPCGFRCRTDGVQLAAARVFVIDELLKPPSSGVELLFWPGGRRAVEFSMTKKPIRHLIILELDLRRGVASASIQFL